MLFSSLTGRSGFRDHDLAAADDSTASSQAGAVDWQPVGNELVSQETVFEALFERILSSKVEAR